MKKHRHRYGRKQNCPCGASKDFCPIIGHETDPAGKCFNVKCGARFFPPKPTHDPSLQPAVTVSTREHIYLTAEGRPHMRIVVKKKSNGKKDPIAYRWEAGVWKAGVEGVGRVLYQLPHLLEAIAHDRTIVIVEGEKDTESATAIGLSATTSPFGALHWQDAYSVIFEGCRVVIVQDNDEAGRQHAQQVRSSLLKAGALSAEVLDLTTLDRDLPEHGDLTDVLMRGIQPERLRSEIERLAALHTDKPNSVPNKPPDIDLVRLPRMFRRLVEKNDDEHQRMALLASSIVSIGSILANITTTYFGRPYSPSLYIYVLGGAGAGKSAILPAELLLAGIHAELNEESRAAERAYTAAVEQWRRTCKKTGAPPPEKPARKLLLIPADATAPVIIRAVCQNPCCMLFDTESDSLASAMRSDTGDISATLRKNFQRETVSYARVGGDVSMSTSSPHLALVMSGTPDQAVRLVRDVANGLVSRIAFIELPDQSQFRNPFASTHDHALNVARELAPSVRGLWAFNVSRKDDFSFTVSLTAEQQHRLVDHYAARFHDAIEENDKATTLRAALICVRIATVLTSVRVWEETGTLDSTMIVTDDDFQTALLLSEFFRRGTDAVVARLQALRPTFALPRSQRRALAWYAALPLEFTTGQAIEIGASHDLSRSTVIAKLKDEGRFHRLGHGRYAKVVTAEQRPP
jgi:hypothetical protein